MNALGIPAAVLLPKATPSPKHLLGRLVAELRARNPDPQARIDLDTLPDRLRADIGLLPREACPAFVIPPVGFGRL